jgi:hypothetical protein
LAFERLHSTYTEGWQTTTLLKSSCHPVLSFCHLGKWLDVWPSNYLGNCFLMTWYFYVYEVFQISILPKLSDLAILLFVLIGTQKHSCTWHKCSCWQLC